MTRIDRKAALIGMVAWSLLVAGLTLTPAGPPGRPTWNEFVCLACADRALADMILNWILFLPGGVFLARLIGRRRAVWMGLLASVAIESLQTVIPGRYPSAMDLILNTAGMASGAWWRFYPLPRKTASRVAAVAALAWLSPSLLLMPQFTDQSLFGLWVPEFGDMAHYTGSVVRASVGGEPTPSRELENGSAVARALKGRAPVNVEFVMGRAPRSAAPIFVISDSEQRLNLIFGVVDDDLILRVRTAARIAHLDQPDGRWAGALADFSAGDTVSASIVRDRGSLCFVVEDVEQCGLAPSQGDGWALLMNLDAGWPSVRTALSVFWSVMLGGLVGLAFLRAGTALGVGSALGLAGFLLAAASPDLYAEAAPALLFAAGAWGGAFAGRVLTDRDPDETQSRSTDTANT